jgi:hypothetical protein
MELLIIAVLLCMLAVVAAWKGADSREAFDSPEWERRQTRGLII